MSFDNDFADLVNRIEKSVHSLAADRIDKIVREVLREVFEQGVSGSFKTVKAETKSRKVEVSKKPVEAKNKREAVYEAIASTDRIRSRKLADATGLNRTSLKYYLDILRKEGRVKMTGNRQNAYYHT